MDITKLNEWIKHKKENPEPDHRFLYKGIPTGLSKEEFEKRVNVIENRAFEKIILDAYKEDIKWERIGGYNTFKAEALVENYMGEEVTLPILARVSSEEDFGFFGQEFYYLHLGVSTGSVPTLSSTNIRGGLFGRFYKMANDILLKN